MVKLSLNLPKHRLCLHLVKRRGADLDLPLFPKLEDIKNTRSGNKLSRFFRHIFEHKNIKKFLGANMAIIVMATQFIPNIPSNVEAEETVIREAQAPIATIRDIQYPTKEIKITQGYSFFHPGLDLDGITGDEIKPVKAGRVEAVSHSKYAYGNAVLINHGNRLTSLYAHLSKIMINEEEEVTTLTKLGEMGATGHAFGDHLHLEIRENGVPINPYLVLPR
ncbi:MAG: M23 family metallopeptidase [bacterium]